MFGNLNAITGIDLPQGAGIAINIRPSDSMIYIPCVEDGGYKFYLYDKYGNSIGLSAAMPNENEVDFQAFVDGSLDAINCSYQSSYEGNPDTPSFQLHMMLRNLSYIPQDGEYHPVVLRMNYNYYHNGVVGANEGLLCNVKNESGTLYYRFPYSGTNAAAQIYRYDLDLQYKGLTPVWDLDYGADDINLAFNLLIQQSGFENYNGDWVAGSNTAPICVVDFPLPDLFGLRIDRNLDYRAALDAMNVGDKIAVMVNGVYVLNELIDVGVGYVIRTYLAECISYVDDSAMQFAYNDQDNNFVIDDSVSCLANIEDFPMTDYWNPIGIDPIRYNFEEDIRYIKYIDILPQFFTEF